MKMEGGKKEETESAEYQEQQEINHDYIKVRKDFQDDQVQPLTEHCNEQSTKEDEISPCFYFPPPSSEAGLPKTILTSKL